MKEIIVVTVALGNDGAERVLTQLTSEWVTMGNKVTILQTNPGQYGCSYETNENVKVISVKPKHSSKPIRVLEEARSVIKILKKNKKAVAVSFIPETTFILAIASLFVKNKIIVSERNNPKKCPSGRLAQKIRNFSFNFADVCVFQTRDVMKMFSGRVQKKGVIIPNPINGSLPEPYFGERNKTIITACRLHPQKNLPMMIRAFHYLHKEHPDYVLEIYGQGNEKEALEHLIAELHLEQNVKLLGFSDNIHEKMRTAAMFVSSSNYEGISNSMLEAMGMGVPTVVTDCPVGGAKMMIRNNQNGVLVPVGDEIAMYKAMKKVIEDPSFADHISRQAAKIRDKYPLSLISRKWLDIF